VLFSGKRLVPIADNQHLPTPRYPPVGCGRGAIGTTAIAFVAAAIALDRLLFPAPSFLSGSLLFTTIGQIAGARRDPPRRDRGRLWKGAWGSRLRA
jgi:hypothetical protein